MASFFTQFKSILDKNKALLKKRARQAERRALSKSLTFTKRELAKDLKIKSSDLNKRAVSKLPNSGEDLNKSGWIWIGIIPLPATLFKPKSIKIGRGKKSKKAVSINVKGEKKTLPQSFLWTSKGGKTLALERKGVNRYPVRQTRVDVLKSSVSNKLKLIKDFMIKEYKNQWGKIKI